MCSKAMMMVMMVMVMMVMSVSPRPHEAPQEMKRIENVVSETLKDIEAAIMDSAKKIKSAIEETVLEEMLEESANKETGGNVAVKTGNSDPAEVNAKKKPAIKDTLAKILAAKKAAALKSAVASSVPSNKIGKGDTKDATTTMDPIDEYCKEACEAGVGGPECDCPDHPIG